MSSRLERDGTECERRLSVADGLFNITRLSFAQYFGTTNSMGIVGQWQTQSIAFGGENQELIELTVNEYRSFCDQIFNMACKNRPAFQAHDGLVEDTDFAAFQETSEETNDF